jgi:hypothetical protein
MRRPVTAADLRDRVLAFLRNVAPFAYCDECLTLRLDTGPADVTTALGALVAEGAVERVRRVCYGCRQTRELAALRDGWRRGV